jgi:hypothetical protein
MYNSAFSRLAANTGLGEIIPLESRLKTKWEKASKKDKKLALKGQLKRVEWFLKSLHMKMEKNYLRL